MMEKRDCKIGACGNYCGGCNDFLAYANDDEELKKKVASDVKEQMNIDVSLKEIGCQGCWGNIHNTWTASLACKIRQCVDQKGLLTCASCDDFSCETFTKQFNRNSDLYKNIERIKEVGQEPWLNEKSNST